MASENTRERILEASLRLFSDRGYDAVGVQEIADVCSVTKPALYYYFSSKSGILEGIMQEYVDPFINLLEKAVTDSNGVVNTVTNFCYCYVENACKNMPLSMMLMSMQYAPLRSESYQVFRRHCSKIFEIAISIFEKSGNELGNMNGRQRQFATTLLGMLGYHMYELVILDNPALDKREVDRLIHQFLHGIYS